MIRILETVIQWSPVICSVSSVPLFRYRPMYWGVKDIQKKTYRHSHRPAAGCCSGGRCWSHHGNRHGCRRCWSARKHGRPWSGDPRTPDRWTAGWQHRHRPYQRRWRNRSHGSGLLKWKKKRDERTCQSVNITWNEAIDFWSGGGSKMIRTSLAISDNDGVDDVADLAESRAEGIVSGVPGQTANEQLGRRRPKCWKITKKQIRSFYRYGLIMCDPRRDDDTDNSHLERCQ